MQCKRRKWIIQCYVIYFFSCVFKQLIGVRIRDIPNNLLLLFPNMEFIIEVFVTFPRTACALVWCVMIYYPTLLIYMLSFSFRVAQSKWMTLGSTTEKQNTITSGHITCVCKNTNMELFTVRHFFFLFWVLQKWNMLRWWWYEESPHTNNAHICTTEWLFIVSPAYFSSSSFVPFSNQLNHYYERHAHWPCWPPLRSNFITLVY